MEYPHDNTLCAPMEWDQEKYGIGVRHIDDQHKLLLDLVTRFGRLVMIAINRGAEGAYRVAKKGVSTFARRGFDPALQRGSQAALIVDELVSYCAKQLQQEEHALESYGYPQRAAHCAEHAVFVKEVSRMFKLVSDGEAEVDDAKRLLYFLKCWIREHIPNADRRYAPLLIEKGVGG